MLSEVELPAPFDAREFCRRVAARRKQPIRLQAVYHQTGIILHEVRHVIAGHYAGSLVGGTQPRFFCRVSGRHRARWRAALEGYTAQEEREAEYFARRVLELVSRRVGPLLDDRLGDTFEEDHLTGTGAIGATTLAALYGMPALLLWPFLARVGWSRVELKDHNRGQVAVGALLGVLTTAVVFPVLR